MSDHETQSLGPDSPEARRFRAALDMHEFGVAMMRQRLRRRFPSAPDAEIRRRLVRWLARLPEEDEGGPGEASL